MNNWLGSRNVAAIKLQERHDHFSDCAITRHTHSLRSCHLPSIMTFFQYVSLAFFSPYVSFFFFFFKKALSQGRRHVHLTFDISLSSRVYTLILIERLQISCRPHDTWRSKLLFFWAQITDSFVQIRDVLQRAPPTFTYNSLNLSRKGSKLLLCKFVFCLFIESLSTRYVILSIHHSTVVCYFIALMSSLSCSRRVRSWFVPLRVPTVSHLRVKSKVKCLPDLPSKN